MGRGGKLDMNIDKVRLADGSKTLLSATKNAKGGGHQGAMTGAIVATSLIFWPAAPFFLMIHGKDITIPRKVCAFGRGLGAACPSPSCRADSGTNRQCATRRPAYDRSPVSR